MKKFQTIDTYCQFSIKDVYIQTKARLFLFFIVFAFQTLARTVDTTIYSNGSPGPYSIGISFADSASFELSFPDSASVPPWTFLQNLNAFLFSASIDSGVPIRVRYTTAFYGVDKLFSLYQKKYALESDTLESRFDSAKFALLPVSREENLAVSGYKSIGVSVGSFGQVNLEQGLDVRIGGNIKPQTALSAHLSDQGSSLDGQTREISDFDMIYVALDDPSYRAVVGDQYVAWPFKGLISGRKKIKGLSAQYGNKHHGRFSLGGFGSLSGGEIAIETRQGRTGVQGPYYLKGKGESEFIQPVTGTVRVRINGRELEEGNDRDFVVDYDLGTISFTPRNLVKDEDLIRIEYEYKLFYYQRSLLGTTTGASGPDSLFSAEGVLWSEADNKSHPIDLTLSNTDVATLGRSGDNTPYASTARPVHPNDVAGESQFYPLYKKSDSTGHFVYTPFSTDHPDSVLGFYYVWFRPANTAGGEKGTYRIAFTDHRGPVYEFDRDSGTFTDLSPVPAPERKTSGEMKLGLRTNLFSATLNLAGQDRDRNLFSAYDDRDNRASATDFSFVAGSKSAEERSAWLSGAHRFTSSRFDAEVLSAYDRKEQWDDIAVVRQTAERQQWETRAGATVLPRLIPELSYGQSREDRVLVTDKLSPSLHYAAWGDRLSLGYDGSFFRHLTALEKGSGRRESGTIGLLFPKHALGLFYRDEWRRDSILNGTGLYEGGLSYDFLPITLHQRISYLSRAKSVPGRFFTKDTGYSVRFEQSINHTLAPWWRLSGTGNIDHSERYGQDRATTMLIDMVNDMDRGEKGLSSRQHYRTSAENASSFIQIPVFAGKGLGTHVYDSARREYVPDSRGDYFMQQKEIYDQASGLRLKKTSADITWSYNPQRKLTGILNDLSWQGTLFCEEHVDADRNGASTWAPGFLSLSSMVGENSSNTGPSGGVRYADISYRQDVDWSPKDSSRTSTGNLFITPAYRRIRNYTESSVETKIGFNNSLRKLTTGGALYLLSLDHKDTTTGGYANTVLNFTLSDRRVEITQKYRLFELFHVSLLEAFGLAQKETGAGGRPLLLDSTFYYQFAPSFSWQPGQKGNVSGIYTYSVVPLTGDIDYRMVRGFSSGIAHRATVTADIKIGERLLIIGTYRGDFRKPVGSVDFEPPNHVFSLEVRAFM